ncbi:MAG: hypothetical protein HYV14_07575 [Elusimicrobia bacterium]|nr:hypothetical protein [Elusimicrobiota bacterium]
MATVQIGRKAPAAGVVLLGLALGLWGIRWGLPGPERLGRVLPPGLDGPAFHQELASSWSAMHASLGENLMVNPKSFGTFTGIVETPAGWKTPPKELLNSYRSFYLRSEHEDEQTILLALSRMKPRRLQFNPHLFTYGALHIYSVGAALALGAATGLVTLKSSLLHYLANPADMGGMYLAGRLLSVAAFVGCGLMLLRLGRRHAGGGEAGVLAAALFLMTPAAVVQAHVLKTHTFWAFLALWTVDRCAAVLARGSLKDYAAAGTVAGLATASFLGAWPACLVVGAAGAMRLAGLHAPDGRPRPPRGEIAGLLAAGLCAVGVFFLVSPYWLTNLGEATAEMKVLSGFSAMNPSHVWLFATNALLRSVTAPVLTLMLGGAALALLKGRREPVLLLCAFAFLLALASTATVGGVLATRQARYFIGWLAVGSLLAGRLLAELRALKGPAGRFGTATAAIVLAGLACQGFSYAYNFSLGEGARSNHFLSGEWIEKNVPEGAQIGLLRYPQPSNSPFFRYDRYRLKFIEPGLAASLPEAQLPRWLALTVPDYDDRPALAPVLSRYERRAVFPRARLFPWIALDPSSTTANPLVEIYALKGKGP